MLNSIVKWNYPTSIRAGCGVISTLSEACVELGIKRPLLVTDPQLARLDIVQSCVREVSAAGLKIEVFSHVRANPIDANVASGVQAYRQGRHDGVVAFGGGSALDCGKLIAFMSGQTRPIWDFEDIGDWWTRADASDIAPIIAVPTTAGTGSEVGRAGVILDTVHHIKRIIFHPRMMPAIVLLDPELSAGLPAHITAATGMDALSHCLEAYCAPGFHPMADGIAMEGMRLIKQALPAAVRDGRDLSAREQMLVAASMGATAFQKGLGGMHALAHPIGALFDTHHGLTNAVVMPYVLAFNRVAIEEKLTRASAYLGLTDPSFDVFLDWILGFRQSLSIPHTLGELNVDAGRIDDLAQMASKDPSAGGNPVEFGAAQARTVLAAAFTGSL